jgi:GNAT superfamily N-acetyltransferase
MTQIRQASADDFDAIVDVHRQTWRETYAGVVSEARIAEGTSEFFTNRWNQAFAECGSPKHAILVAEHDNRIVGVLRLSPDETQQKRALLTYAHVLPDVQGSGVGSALVTRAKAWATFEFNAIALWVVDGHRDADRFWKRHGWNPTGNTRVQTGPDWSFVETEYTLSLP